MATDYTELKDEIQRWLDNNNPNLIAEIPTFIADAEAWVSRHLHTRDMECRTSTPLTPAGVTEETLGIYDLPADWGGHKEVDVVGDTLYILYWRKLAALSDTNATNWLLTKAPDLYRYASLAAAESWLKNDPRVPAWSQAADRALQELERHDVHDRFSGGPLAARRLEDRPWVGYRKDAGRYEYLVPYDFFDLKASGMVLKAEEKFFTVHQSFLEIYPKPELPAP